MKKGGKRIAIIVIVLILLGIYYYVTIPAINIHSAGFWQCLLFLIAALTIAYGLIKGGKDIKNQGRNWRLKELLAELKLLKAGIVLFLLTAVVYFAGSVLSSPIVNASKYQKLLTVENSDFSKDIKEVSYNTIPLLDKSSAELLGNRKMGSMVDMVSQFEVSSEYTQINYQDTPVRVAPLVYASPVKWLTNQKEGIPAYIRIDMATQNTECVKLSAGIRYSESEFFNRNIYRHLRFHYPTYIFDDQIFFEIDDEGTPFWVCPVKKFNIGLFGGQTIGEVVLCNAITGACQEYDVEDVPNWIDKVYSAELLMRLYNYNGTLKHGYFNSILVNISGEPTYFMALKDGAGLVKKYAMVNVQKYQWVAIGDTVQECEKAYVKLLATNGITKGEATGIYETAKGKIASIAPVVIEGNTHYYVCLENSEEIFDVNVADTTLVEIVRYTAKDVISFEYEVAESGICTVVSIKNE